MSSSGTINSYDLNRHALDVFFKPRNVAVIGATDRPHSVGQSVMVNLSNGTLEQKVFPVNLKRETVAGLKAYHKIKDVPELVDPPREKAPIGATSSSPRRQPGDHGDETAIAPEGRH